MKKYESAIILKPTLTEQEISKVILKIRNTIKEYGEITDENDIGKKKLVFEIKKYKEGFYRIFQFKISDDRSAEAICEIERIYRITDEIIKYITIKVNEEEE